MTDFCEVEKIRAQIRCTKLHNSMRRGIVVPRTHGGQSATNNFIHIIQHSIVHTPFALPLYSFFLSAFTI
jgi:hypothetical protein